MFDHVGFFVAFWNKKVWEWALDTVFDDAEGYDDRMARVWAMMLEGKYGGLAWTMLLRMQDISDCAACPGMMPITMDKKSMDKIQRRLRKIKIKQTIKE